MGRPCSSAPGSAGAGFAEPSPENFVLKEIPTPSVQHGTLLIKLAATSVNSIDIKIREGALAIAPPLPAVLGSDIAETVVEARNPLT